MKVIQRMTAVASLRVIMGLMSSQSHAQPPVIESSSLNGELVCAGTSAKVGFHGATPTTQRANTNQAAATDLATVITLANEHRDALVEKDIIKGGA